MQGEALWWVGKAIGDDGLVCKGQSTGVIVGVLILGCTASMGSSRYSALAMSDLSVLLW